MKLFLYINIYYFLLLPALKMMIKFVQFAHTPLQFGDTPLPSLSVGWGQLERGWGGGGGFGREPPPSPFFPKKGGGLNFLGIHSRKLSPPRFFISKYNKKIFLHSKKNFDVTINQSPPHFFPKKGGSISWNTVFILFSYFFTSFSFYF